MAKLSKEEAEQLAALRAKEEAPDEDDEGQGDDGHVIVLRGSRADSFLSELLGTKTKTPAKKAAPAAKPSARNPKRTPASTEGDAEGDDQGDEGDAEGDTEGDDTPPPAKNRYFR